MRYSTKLWDFECWTSRTVIKVQKYYKRVSAETNNNNKKKNKKTNKEEENSL